MRAFRITVFAAPRVKPDGDPNASDGVYWSRTGSPWEGDLAALVGLLTTPTPAPGKYACPYFVAGSLHDGVRRGEHFELASVIGLDIDTGITSVETHRRFLSCAHVIYMSWSHRPDAPRFRLVIPLSRDVDAREYKLLWQVLSGRIPGSVDPKTRDLARALFLPAVRPDGWRAPAKAWLEAPTLDPDALLVEALALVQAPAPPRRPSPPVCLPPELARAVAARRLATDPEVRRRAAEHLPAAVRDTRAERIPGPKCGRPSVWFWLDPAQMKTARCNHRNSCGWWGRLEDLIDANGGERV